MSAAARCAAAIRRVGGSCTLIRGEERFALIASLQPLNTEKEPEAGPMGFIDVSQYYLYLSADGIRPVCGDTVIYSGFRYSVRSCEIVFFAGQPAYYRAVLRPESGEGTA